MNVPDLKYVRQTVPVLDWPLDVEVPRHSHVLAWFCHHFYVTGASAA